MVRMRRCGGRTWFARVCALVLAFFLFFGWPAQSAAYAVLSHEAIIDSAWDTNIRPVLLMRFPCATGEELKEAHGYAYGGVIIQDMGYYPHGSFFFSDLTHYVRSGDFVLALLNDAKDLDGYSRHPDKRRVVSLFRRGRVYDPLPIPLPSGFGKRGSLERCDRDEVVGSHSWSEDNATGC